MDILDQFPFLGIMERVLEKIPREYLEGFIYKESSPKEYGMNKRKKHRRK